MEIGNTCGKVMTMLPYLGVKTFPVANFDVSPQGYQIFNVALTDIGLSMMRLKNTSCR
jgi:hypothetical protein